MPKIAALLIFLRCAILLAHNKNHVVPACKERSVRYPEASGFCYRANEFCY